MIYLGFEWFYYKRLSLFKQIPDIGIEQIETGLFFYTFIGCVGGFGFSKLLYGFYIINFFRTLFYKKPGKKMHAIIRIRPKFIESYTILIMIVMRTVV
jgi:hypothetical protein